MRLTESEEMENQSTAKSAKPTPQPCARTSSLALACQERWEILNSEGVDADLYGSSLAVLSCLNASTAPYRYDTSLPLLYVSIARMATLAICRSTLKLHCLQ